ncbi:MAG: glycosyltransferase family 39 protein [Acidobacteriota bacterium]
MTRRLPSWAIPVLAGLIFLATGVALLPWPGMQNDELFFSGPIYSADAAFYRIEGGALKIPLMVMSYTGALKTWLYAALFQVLPPTEWSVRIPVLLMGIGTLWLTWEWVRRIADERAAAVATVLLATDTIFLMTGVFDWGPVALQHILLMGGLLAVQIWIARPSKRMLSLGFFLWGLGMWDKALMAWPLIGLAAAVVCVFPRETARRVRLAPALLALVSFLAGAAPLVWYNIARPGETATQNAKFTTQDLGSKIVALRQTIDGSTLFGYIVYEDSVAGKRAPRGLGERLPVELSRRVGDHRRNWMLPAWILGLMCALVLWNSPVRRPLLFLAIAVLVGWAQMALTKGTGGASHHVILLWPFPAVFLGIAFSAVARKLPRFGTPALAALLIFLAGENLLTTNQYLARLIVNGGAGGWTDAIYRLADSLDKKSASWFGILDWGYLNGVRMLHEGDLPLFLVDVNADPAEFRREIGSPDYLFIQHTDDKEIFAGINDRLRKAAAQAGYVERLERRVPDRNGRPVFELFRFSKAE